MSKSKAKTKRNTVLMFEAITTCRPDFDPPLWLSVSNMPESLVIGKGVTVTVSLSDAEFPVLRVEMTTP